MKEVVQSRLRAHIDTYTVFEAEIARIEKQIQESIAKIKALKEAGKKATDPEVKEVISKFTEDNYRLTYVYQDSTAVRELLTEFKTLIELADMETGLPPAEDKVFRDLEKSPRMFTADGGSVVIYDQKIYDAYFAQVKDRIDALDYESVYNSPLFTMPSSK